MLVANIVEHMKGTDSKQLAAYPLERCIALISSLPLLYGFAVQTILA